MRIPKQIYLLSFLVLFISNCVLFLPNGGSQTDFSLFGFLLGLVGGSPTSAQNLTPGAAVDLSGDGNPEGTLVDSDGDSISDGINLTGGTTPNLILIDTNGDGVPDAVDSNGDGLPDYYISPNPPGFLTTGPGGTGNPVVIVVDANGNPLGFDTDGDGTPNDTAIVTILSDTTPPTITSSLLTGTFSTTQTTTLTCSDNKAPGSIVYTLDASAPAFSPKNGTLIVKSSKAVSLSTEGTHTLQAICRDLAGNVSLPTNIVYTIDTKIPALSIVSQSSTSISASAGAISSSSATWRTDRSGSFTIREGSSCDSGTIATTGSATANVDQGFVRSHTHFTSEGTKTYRICVTGTNGLTGFVSVTLQRDDTAPVVTATPGTGNYGVATSVSLSCSDTGGSGCDQIAYAVQAGSAPTNPAIQGTTGTVSSGILYTAAFSITDASVTYIKFVARDKAGNVSGVSSQNYTVDTQVATITVNSHTAAIGGVANASLSWQSSKAGSYQIRLGGTSCSTGTALTNTGSNANVTGNITATTETTSTIANSHFVEGDNTIRICVANLIGSFGSTTRYTNKDTTAPTLTMASPSGSGPFASGTQLQLSCSDTSGSGCDKIIYTLNGTEPTFDGSGAVTNGTVYSSPVALSNGSNQVKYLARDLAGNLSTSGNQSFHVGPPSSPVFVEAHAGGTSAIVQWWPVTGATSYTVYYSTSPGVTTSSTSFGPVTDPHATITGLTGGTLYYFRVVASSAFGSSGVNQFEAMASTTATQPGTSESGIHIDLSAGFINVNAGKPVAIIDPFNFKILVVAEMQYKPALYRCELNGSNCTYHDISVGQIEKGRGGHAIIDPINKKLLVLNTNYDHTKSELNLFRCNLDGSGCIYKEISNGQEVNGSHPPSMLFEPIHGKLLVFFLNKTNYKYSLLRCDLDGTSCEFRDISAGQGNGQRMVPLLDSVNRKLLVVSGNSLNQFRPNLVRCNLDGTSCTSHDISAGQGYGSGSYPSAALDSLNGKLLVVTMNQSNSSKPSLFKCNLDGSSCTHQDISAGQVSNYGQYPSIVLDSLNGKLLTFTTNAGGGLSQFLCNLDGYSCVHKLISVGQGSNSGLLPSAVLDSIGGKLFIATMNSFNPYVNYRSSLYIW